MATPAAATVRAEESARAAAEPLLEQGDRLSRAEFERRYEGMPHIRKAELVEGTVYMPSPLHAGSHAEPHSRLGTWLGTYAAETPIVRCFDNSTVRLDLDNEPQPDLVLIKLPEKGGQARISDDDYIEGAPELVVEIVGSSRAYDLHQKKGAYRRNSVREYLASRSVCSGGSFGTRNIRKSQPPPKVFSRAASSRASGSTPPRCCAGT